MNKKKINFTEREVRKMFENLSKAIREDKFHEREIITKDVGERIIQCMGTAVSFGNQMKDLRLKHIAEETIERYLLSQRTRVLGKISGNEEWVEHSDIDSYKEDEEYQRGVENYLEELKHKPMVAPHNQRKSKFDDRRTV